MHTINRFKEHIKSIFSASKESITMIPQRQIFFKKWSGNAGGEKYHN